MDTLPVRRRLATHFHDAFGVLEKRLTLPNVNPSYYHTLAILLSVLYLFANMPAQKIAIIGIVLVADWLDGATVRQYRVPSKAGCVVDLVTDRASEAFIFAAEAGTVLGEVFFLLWIVNCVLTYYSVWANTHTTLPLRLAFLIILVVQLYAPMVGFAAMIESASSLSSNEFVVPAGL